MVFKGCSISWCPNKQKNKLIYIYRPIQNKTAISTKQQFQQIMALTEEFNDQHTEIVN